MSTLLPSKFSRLRKSPENDILFWVDECKEVGKEDWLRNKDSKWKNVAHAEWPEEQDFYRALKMKMGNTKEKEEYLRLNAWHYSNNKFRYAKHLTNPKRSAEEIDNMRLLFSLLDGKDSNDRALKAEIARELGEFEKAEELLDFAFEERHKEFVGFIKGFVEERDTSVRKLEVE